MKPKTFEEKLQYTKSIVEKLSDPELGLEEAVKLYEAGLKSIKEAQKALEEAKLKIETIERNEQSE